MADSTRVLMLMSLIRNSRLGREKRNKLILILLKSNAQRRKHAAYLIGKMLLYEKQGSIGRPRRVLRNQGWFENVLKYE